MRPFVARVRAVEDVSPSFRRITLRSREFARLAPNGLDQPIHLMIPNEDGPQGWHQLVGSSDWFADWCAQPAGIGNHLRTYTLRDFNPRTRQVVLDIVVGRDGPTGPGVRWAERAAVGDRVMLIGPDARHPRSDVGVRFRPGSAAGALLISDEAGLPAVASIIQSCDPALWIAAFVEVPTVDDFLDIPCRPNAYVSWASRDGWAGESVAGEGHRVWRQLGFESARVGETLVRRLQRWLDLRRQGTLVVGGSDPACPAVNAPQLARCGNVTDIVRGPFGRRKPYYGQVAPGGGTAGAGTAGAVGAAGAAGGAAGGVPGEGGFDVPLYAWIAGEERTQQAVIDILDVDTITATRYWRAPRGPEGADASRVSDAPAAGEHAAV